MALVTVFGGSGNIGRQVVKQLAAQGHQVRVAVRDPEAALFLKPMGDVGQITPLQANLRHAGSVQAAVGSADAVVNLVGILYEGGRQRFDAIHAEGAGLVAREAAAAGVGSLVHISALGADAGSPAHYARSKAAGEEAVRSAFPAATILRPSVVFGPHDSFFNRFAAMASLPLPIPVFGCDWPKVGRHGVDLYGDGGTKFQPVYVGDVADAVVKCLFDPSTHGKVYELAGPRVYSFVDLMRIVLRETRRQRPLVPVPFPVATIVAAVLELLPFPLLTRDQVTLLKKDNVPTGENPTLADLGIEPTAAELIVPGYLEQYRRGGRYTRVQAV